MLGAPGRLSSPLHPLSKQALINHQMFWPFDLELPRMARKVSIYFCKLQSRNEQSELGFSSILVFFQSC